MSARLGQHPRSCRCLTCLAEIDADFEAARAEADELRRMAAARRAKLRYCRTCGMRSGHWKGCPKR